MFENSKHFPTLVGLSALLIAGSAAFFSVFGLFCDEFIGSFYLDLF